MSDAPELWERQEGEPPKAWKAFVIYRDMGHKRSFNGASRNYYEAQEPKRSPSSRTSSKAGQQIRKWAADWNWISRAAAWDAFCDTANRSGQIEAIREAAERHVKYAKALQFKAIEKLTNIESDKLTISETLRFIVEAVKLERLALGEPTETIGNAKADGSPAEAGTPDEMATLLKSATTDELKKIQEAIGAVAARLRPASDDADDRQGVGGTESSAVHQAGVARLGTD